MKKLRRYWRTYGRVALWIGVVGLGLVWLLWHRLGSLTGGLSRNELLVVTTPIGWHGMYQHPLYLPLDLIRSIVFFLDPGYHQFLARWPNTLFGGLAILCFGRLIWLWHGPRTAIMATALFATSAWTLHVSRLASFDVLYLWAVPAVLLAQFELQRGITRRLWWYVVLLTVGLMLYLPGMIWLILLSAWLQRQPLRETWARFNRPHEHLIGIAAVVIWLPLLLRDLIRPGRLVEWLGLPADFPSIVVLVKQFVLVPVNLFIRGPYNPELWLGRIPLLDVFTLTMVVLGGYFYAMHRRSRRTKLLASTFALGVVLVGLGGAVGLSFIMPVLYMAAATGIAFLLHAWLKTFPRNPLARGLGVGLISVAVAVACVYNYRAYFVAWPHNSATRATFSHHR